MHKFYQRHTTFEEVLEEKEKRARIQEELCSLYRAPLACITVNMPGSQKYTDDTIDLLYNAMSHLRNCVREAGFTLYEERIYHALAGPSAFMVIDGDTNMIKRFGISIEEKLKYGRLLDIDVFDEEGRQVNRLNLGLKERSCIVCSQPAVYCLRSESHHREEILSKVKERIICFKAEQTNIWPKPVIAIGNAALKAILMEAACSPAPGLVDRFNSGAHNDMDFFTFMASSSAINLAMYRCAMAGWVHQGEPHELLGVLRAIGLEAENSMFLATNGVNCHKGMIFLMGILSASASLEMRKQNGKLTSQAITQEAAMICKGIVKRELSVLRYSQPERNLTAGERLYLNHGVTGIRGEIEAGLPSVHEMGLPLLRKAIREGLSLNDALIHALIGIMSITTDTTIINRHNLEVLSRVQQEAASILEDGAMLSPLGRRRIGQLDQAYSRNRISPGGAADLLAATYFLHFLELGLCNTRDIVLHS